MQAAVLRIDADGTVISKNDPIFAAN